MRFYFLFVVLLFTAGRLFSQVTLKKYARHAKKIQESKIKNKAILTYDTIFNQGSAYAVFKKIKVSPLLFDYQLLSLNNKELIDFKKEIMSTTFYNDEGTVNYKGYFTVNFIQSGNSCEIAVNTSKLVKFIIENNLLQQNEINSEAEKRLIQIYGNNISRKYCVQHLQNYQSNTNYTIAHRNRNMPVYINGANILQDNVIIANIIKQQNYVKANKIKVVTFFEHISGNPFAQVTLTDGNNYNREVITFSDRKKHYVKASVGNEQKNIAQYLIHNF